MRQKLIFLQTEKSKGNMETEKLLVSGPTVTLQSSSSKIVIPFTTKYSNVADSPPLPCPNDTTANGAPSHGSPVSPPVTSPHSAPPPAESPELRVTDSPDFQEKFEGPIVIPASPPPHPSSAGSISPTSSRYLI